MRVRVRVLALLAALALFVIAAIPASAEGRDRTYLALGDSVAFGTNPLVDPRNANNFTGYPTIAGQRLDMSVVNTSCPGEATGSFISLTGLDNVCRPYRAAFPLHTAYTGTQLAFAVNFLKHHRETKLVSLGLDANDFFRESSGPDPNGWPPSTCFVPAPADTAGLVTYFSTCAVQNLKTILTGIRSTAHYHGTIVIVLYYALNYGDPASVFVSGQLLNKAMITAGTPFHVRFADGFKAFKAAAAPFGGDSCKAGLLIVVKASPLTCDVHPTPKGRDLLAGAVVRAVEGEDD
jgi:lysophospholipase L1-like esterase